MALANNLRFALKSYRKFLIEKVSLDNPAPNTLRITEIFQIKTIEDSRVLINPPVIMMATNKNEITTSNELPKSCHLSIWSALGCLYFRIKKDNKHASRTRSFFIETENKLTALIMKSAHPSSNLLNYININQINFFESNFKSGV